MSSRDTICRTVYLMYYNNNMFKYLKYENNYNLLHYRLLTDNIEISNLSFSSDRIYLTHVTASIFLLHIVYVQKPRTVFIVGHGNPWISSDHVAIHGQYGRLFKVHPSYLQTKILF